MLQYRFCCIAVELSITAGDIGFILARYGLYQRLIQTLS